MYLRLLTEDDLETTRAWRNHPDSQRWFGDTKLIQADAQQHWFHSRAGITDDYIYILRNDKNIAVAQLSVYNIDKTNRIAEVGRFLVDPTLRRQGFFQAGFALLKQQCSEALALKTLFLRVKQDNHPAIAAYLQCGFSTTANEAPYDRMELTL